MTNSMVRALQVGSVVLNAVACSLAWGGSTAHAANLAPEPSTVALLTIEGQPRGRAGELDWLFGSEEHPTLREIILAIEDVATDDSYDGLLLRLKDADLDAFQAEEIGEAILEVREQGKRVDVFAESFGPHEFMVGAFANSMLAQKGGAVSLPGISMEEMFLGDTLAWAGLKADMVQVGDFKGANEQMTRAKPSEAWSRNIDQLLDTLYQSQRAPILAGRKLTDAQLDAAMAQLWMADANEAVNSGLLDGEVDLPELAAKLGEFYDHPVKFDDIVCGEEGQMASASGNPFAAMSLLTKQPPALPTGPCIAVVHIDGPIIDGDSSAGGMFGEGGVGSRTIRNALETVRSNDNIKGAVLRIDSPGGSATASEIIWQGVRRVAEKKPVWVSVGSMAASGGYYIAVAGQKVYVDPSSIVGSIGVVGGKISMGGLYEKLHVGTVVRSRGPRGAMFASGSPWSDTELELVRSKMTQTFDLFKSRVAAGRPGADINRVAGGWLFAGSKAIEMGLADEVGSELTCISALAEELALPDGGYDVVDYPAPRALSEVLEDAFSDLGAGIGARAPKVCEPEFVSAAKALLGDRAWRQIAPSAEALVQMREPKVLLLSPSVIIVK